MPLIGLLARRAANINSFRRLITSKSSSGIVAIGSYEVGTAARPSLITFSANNSGNSVSSTSFALSSAVSPQASKTAPNLSSISSI